MGKREKGQSKQKKRTLDDALQKALDADPLSDDRNVVNAATIIRVKVSKFAAMM